MNNELLATLEYLERDRGLDRQTLVELIEESMVIAARKAVGPVNELQVKLDPKTGDIKATARLTAVEKVSDANSEIALREARKKYPEVEPGEELEWEVAPDKDFGRIVAQSARQGIMQRLRMAERHRVLDEYRDRLGELLYGTISRFDKGDIIVQLERTEGVLPQSSRVPMEDYQIGDHVSCVLVDLNTENPGPTLVLSRATPQLVQRLFEREVAEIAENIVEVKGVAREPGFRSKIAVHSNDSQVDPVGACVGIRGSRVKTVVRELNGEKVDIVRYDTDLRNYIANALQPATIRALQVDEDSGTVTITVDQDQLSLAIGKRGQNARLTAKLTGWKIDISRGAQEAPEESIESKIEQAVTTLAELPGLTEDIASRLVHSGFLSVEGIRAADVADLEAVEGIDHETAVKIKEACGG